MPSIEWQYEAAYLSLLLLLSWAHFYERIHQPVYRWSLRSAPIRFLLSLSLYSRLRSSLISLVFTSFFLLGKQGFSRCRKSRNVRSGSKSKSSCNRSKYFHTRCSFVYFWHVLILLDDVESFPMDAASKHAHLEGGFLASTICKVLSLWIF